jgi:hypothetical protein
MMSSFHVLLKTIKNLLFTIVISFSIIYTTSLFAATPNPGHPWREVGDGFWAATGTTAFRTFTFPDATSTALTTNDLVTVGQGGTGQNSTSSAMNAFTGLVSKGDIFIRGSSIVGRLVAGINNQVLLASSSQSLGVVWGTPSPSPSGSNTHVQFNDGGSMGASSALAFDKTTNTLGLNGELNLTTQADPAAPSSGILSVYSKTVSGRPMLKAVGPSGVNYAYQPSFFQNAIFIISTGAGTAYTIMGGVASSTGTVSHVVSQSLGYMANQITANAAGNTAGTGNYASPYYIGSQAGSNGFFFQARMAFPDATSTGIRAFVGFTSGLHTASVSADDPAGSGLGWQYSTSRGDTGWKFMTDSGSTQTVSSTILPMEVGAVFDFFIYCPPHPNNGTVYYRIDNLTAGTSAEGSTSTTLPGGTTPLSAGFQINNVNSGTRSVRVSRLYVETDR